jgi:hypothetical protein
MGRAATSQRAVIAAAALICFAAWSLQCVAANGKPAGPPSAQSIISQWQALFPEHPYVCWQKESPWRGLDKLQSPPAGVESLQTISLHMGRDEYESTSFVLTSLSPAPMTFTITSNSSGSSGISTTLRKAVWVTVDGGSQVNDALSLIDDGQVVIASGESLEIWVTLHSNSAAAGNYRWTLEVLPQGLGPRSVNVAVTVHDLALPEPLPLAVFYFDELEGTRMAPGVVDAYLKDMKSHYVNHAFVHPNHLPRLAVGSNGQFATDWTKRLRRVIL